MMSAMLFRTELSYDAAPDAVLAMLTDPAFREKVCAAQHVVSCDVRIDLAGAGFTCVVTSEQNTAGLPSIAKKFVGETTTAIITEDWKDGAGGTVEIKAPGKPTDVSGTIRLVEAGAGTTEVVELNVKAKVPLIGGKLEKVLVDSIQAGYDVEQRVGAAWLAGER